MLRDKRYWVRKARLMEQEIGTDMLLDDLINALSREELKDTLLYLSDVREVDLELDKE